MKTETAVETTEVEEEVYQDEDFCGICTPIRRELGLAPYLLVRLPRTTARKGFIIRACPNCDGGVAQLGMREDGTF